MMLTGSLSLNTKELMNTKIVIVAVACLVMHCGDDNANGNNNPIFNSIQDGGIELDDLGQPNISPVNPDAGGSNTVNPDAGSSNTGGAFGGNFDGGSVVVVVDNVNDSGLPPAWANDAGINDVGTVLVNQIQELNEIKIGSTEEIFLTPKCRLGDYYGTPHISPTGDVLYLGYRAHRFCKYTASQPEVKSFEDIHLVVAFANNGGYVTYSGDIVPDPATPHVSYKFEKYGRNFGSRDFVSFNPTSTHIYIITADGELPGESPELKNYPLLVRYNMSGDILWQKRLKNYNSMSKPMDVVSFTVSDHEEFFILSDRYEGILDSEGSSIWFREYKLEKLDKDGKLLFSKFFASLFTFSSFGISADGQSAYFISNEKGKKHLLTKLDFKDNNSWQRLVSFGHEVVIDKAEEVIWEGKKPLSPVRLIMRSGNGPCLATEYANSFKNSPIPRRQHENIIISCFDDQGTIQGALQYRFASGVFPGESNLRSATLREMADGTWVLVGYGSDPDNISNTGTYVFHLNANGSEKK